MTDTAIKLLSDGQDVEHVYKQSYCRLATTHVLTLDTLREELELLIRSADERRGFQVTHIFILHFGFLLI